MLHQNVVFARMALKWEKLKLRQDDNSCIQYSIQVISFPSWMKDCCYKTQLSFILKERFWNPAG